MSNTRVPVVPTDTPSSVEGTAEIVGSTCMLSRTQTTTGVRTPVLMAFLMVVVSDIILLHVRPCVPTVSESGGFTHTQPVCCNVPNSTLQL
jgi:hypothetical protein